MYTSVFTKSLASIGPCQSSRRIISSGVRIISSTAINNGAEEAKILGEPHNESDRGNIEEENNPLLKLKSIAQIFDLCDRNGFRNHNRHWTFALSIADTSSSNEDMTNASEYNRVKMSMSKAPILRTVHFQRISEKGIDFVMKNKGHASDSLFLKDQGVSFLYTLGQYLPGQTIQQWRSRGICEPIRLKEIIEHVPSFTIVEMVASLRANKEGDSGSDMDLSHFTELVQQTRQELDNGQVPMMELEEAVRAWRIVPYQVEQMIGGPEKVMWERNEWLRDSGDGKNDNNWIKPVRLMPF